MFDEHQAAAGGSELLLDLGTLVTGGRRPNRAVVAIAWLSTFGGALALWRWFAWLFDHFPAWAVLAGGFWLMLLVLSLGLFGAAVKYGSASGRFDSDLPPNER